jgi:hypothetical protein
VLIGIVYGYLPLMVFPIYVSLEKLDKRLLEASADLGASAFELSQDHPAPLGTGDHHRGDAGVYPADGRVPDPGHSRWRQGVLCRQRAGRPVPAVAQLAVRQCAGDDPGGDDAGDHRRI